MKKATKR